MHTDNHEPIPVGIKTTTLQEIEKQFPDKYKFIMADLFEQPHSQSERLTDRPENLPFMFCIGGGLSFLDNVEGGKPEWKTTEWIGDPPLDYSVGNIYFTKGADIFVKVADNPDNSWIWQKLTGDEGQLSWKAGRKDWEYKLYFAPEHKNSASLNNSLNEKGWTYFSVWEDEDMELPEELQSQQIEGWTIDDRRKDNYVVIDPDRGELRKVVWGNETEDIVPTLEAQDWELIDSNIARGIFVRTKPEN